MSSMLKKTGGLSFKPKAGRRPGAGSSKPAASSTSAPTTRSPTTEPQSQATTPADSHLSTPPIIDSIEPPTEPSDKLSIPAEPQPTPTQIQNSPAPEPRVDVSPVQPTSEPVVSQPPPSPLPTVQNRTPEPSNEIARRPASPLESHRLVTDPSRHTTQPSPNAETGNGVLSAANTLSQPPATPPASTLGLPDLGEAVAPGPPTTPAPPPVSHPILTASQPGETVSPRIPVPKNQTSTRRKSTTANSKTGADGSVPKKRQRSNPRTPSANEASQDMNVEAQRPVRRRKREPTPENAEELTVDHSTMTVGELTKDLGIGKRFRHAEEIEQRAREARAKYRLRRLEREKRRLGLLPPEDEDSALQLDTPDESGESRGAAIAQLGASMESGGQGVGYDVVDGQIVVHAASLVVDRHNRDMSNLEEVEENDFTNLVNSASFAKRVQAPGNWTEEETEKFYRLLGMFGTDFETISRLFPGKNRRAIKLKFNKEERLRPNRVNAAMMVRGQKKVNIDLEEYKATQRQWQAKDKILAEHARLAQEHEREVARLREERRAAGLIDDDNHAHNTSTNTTTSGKRDGEIEVIEEDADALGQGRPGLDIDMDPQPESIQA